MFLGLVGLGQNECLPASRPKPVKASLLTIRQFINCAFLEISVLTLCRFSKSHIRLCLFR